MKVTIYIPKHLATEAMRDSLVAVAGGCTAVLAEGSWYDAGTATVINEEMLLVSTIIDPSDSNALSYVLVDICTELFAQGEKVVLIESLSAIGYFKKFVTCPEEVEI